MSADSLRGAEEAAASQSNVSLNVAVQPCLLAKALEVLFLGEDGRPVSGIGLQLREEGQAMAARTGPDGLARFDGLTSAACQLCPFELDQDAWNMLRLEPLDASEARSRAAASWRKPVPALPESSGIMHAIAEGEALDRVAFARGLFPATVWDHAQNGDLRGKRESGNVLLQGDGLFIPPIQRKEIAVEVAFRYILRRCGVPSRLRIRLMDDLRILSNAAWSLEIPGEATLSGETGEDGILEAWVPATATSATVTFVAGDQRRQVTILLGTLTPAHEGGGWRQRLHNLGFRCDLEGGMKLSAEDRGSLLRFQDSYGLPLTGESDPATLEKLRVIHDGAATESPSAGVYSPSF